MVIDSSAIVATMFADERTPPVLAVRQRVALEGAVVPPLWWIEVANALLTAGRRGRATAEERTDHLRDLSALPIVTDDEPPSRTWTSVLRLAELHRLTAYDAVYLDLALRRGLPLASLDRELNAAAERSGVEVLIR